MLGHRKEFDGPLGILNAIMAGSVRARALLTAQTESARIAISRVIEEDMERFRGSGGNYRVPMPAVVGAGVK